MNFYSPEFWEPVEMVPIPPELQWCHTMDEVKAKLAEAMAMPAEYLQEPTQQPPRAAGGE